MRIRNRKETAAPRAKPSDRKKAITAPAVSASWASTFLGGKTGYQKCPRGCTSYSLLSSMESWEEATEEPEAVLLCSRGTARANPPWVQEPASKLGACKKRVHQADCPQASGARDTPPCLLPHALQPAWLSPCCGCCVPHIPAELPSMADGGNREPKQELPHL